METNEQPFPANNPADVHRAHSAEKLKPSKSREELAPPGLVTQHY